MNIRMLAGAGVLIASLSSPADATEDRSKAYYAEVAEHLLASETARSTLLGARLLRMASAAHDEDGKRIDAAPDALDARIGELARAAALRGVDDSQVQWVLASGTFGDEAPELQAAALARLLALEPDNLAPRMLGGEIGPWSSARVNAAAKASRVDFAFFERVRSDLALLEPFEIPPALLPEWHAGSDANSLDAHQIMLMGMMMAEALPGLQGLVQACSPGQPGWLPLHRAACEHIAGMLAGSDETPWLVSLGQSIQALLADTAAEREAVARARRIERYRQEQMGRLLMTDAAADRAMGAALRKPGVGEVEVRRQMLLEAGIPDEPPADWQSTYPSE